MSQTTSAGTVSNAGTVSAGGTVASSGTVAASGAVKTPSFTDIHDMPITLDAYMQTLKDTSSPDRIFGRMLRAKHQYSAASPKEWRKRIEALMGGTIEAEKTVVIGKTAVARSSRGVAVGSAVSRAVTVMSQFGRRR